MAPVEIDNDSGMESQEGSAKEEETTPESAKPPQQPEIEGSYDDEVI